MTKNNYPRLHTLKYEIAPQFAVANYSEENTDSTKPKADSSENASPIQ